MEKETSQEVYEKYNWVCEECGLPYLKDMQECPKCGCGSFVHCNLDEYKKRWEMLYRSYCTYCLNECPDWNHNSICRFCGSKYFHFDLQRAIICFKVVKRGKLIVVEGIDNSGKTTLLREIEQLYPGGAGIVKLNFPDRTTSTGRIIDDFLKGNIVLKPDIAARLFSENRQEKRKLIDEYLNMGYYIFIDRYVFSGICYAAVNSGRDVINDYEELVTYEKGLPVPDLVVYIDVPDEVILKSRGPEVFEKVHLQVKIKAQYHKLFEDFKDVYKVLKFDYGTDVKKMVDKIFSELVNKENGKTEE